MIDGLSQIIFNVYEAFTVAFFTRTEEYLRCRSSVTFAESFDKNRSIPIEGTLPGWVIKHNEPLIIPNFDKDEATLGYYGANEDIKSFIGFPLEGKGVIVVDSKKKWAFTDKEKKILAGFAGLIQNELEKERKASELEEKLDELLLQRRMIGLLGTHDTTVDSVTEILEDCLGFCGGDVAFTGLERNGRLYIETLAGIEKNGYLRKECPPGNSIASIVLEGGREFILPFNSGYLRERPLFFPQETVKARQIFAFPLTSEESPFGVVGFASLSDRPLKEQSIGLLRDAANLLSLLYRSHWTKEYLKKAQDIEPVTGALQFPRFLRMAEQALGEGRRFAILSVKVRNLGSWNRRMGIEQAEALLVRVFDVLRYCAGTRVPIGRRGARFYLLITDNDGADPVNLLKITQHTIKKSVAKDAPVDAGDFIESGVARFPDDSRDLWQLFDRAEGQCK
jgi:GGDEF domain-containing protein